MSALGSRAQEKLRQGLVQGRVEYCNRAFQRLSPIQRKASAGPVQKKGRRTYLRSPPAAPSLLRSRTQSAMSSCVASRSYHSRSSTTCLAVGGSSLRDARGQLSHFQPHGENLLGEPEDGQATRGRLVQSSNHRRGEFVEEGVQGCCEVGGGRRRRSRWIGLHRSKLFFAKAWGRKTTVVSTLVSISWVMVCWERGCTKGPNQADVLVDL